MESAVGSEVIEGGLITWKALRFNLNSKGLERANDACHN